MLDPLSLAVWIAFAALAILFFIALSGILHNLRNKTTNPTLQNAIDAAMPWVNKGILAAEKLETKAFQEADRQLTTLEVSGIAQRVYDLMPDVLHLTTPIGILPIPVKQFVTPAIFAALIKKVYDESHAFILANETYLSPPTVTVSPLAKNPDQAGG